MGSRLPACIYIESVNEMIKSNESLSFGGFTFQPETATLVDANGQVVALRAQTLDLFLTLSTRPNQLYSREELVETLWPDAMVTDASLTQCVAELRKALGDTKKQILITVPRRGYRLVPDELGPETVSLVAAVKSSPLFYKTTIAAVCAALLMIVGVADMRSGGEKGAEAVKLSQAGLYQPATNLADGKPAIAINLFKNLSGSERLSRLAEGITSDLVAATATAHWLQVFRIDDIDETSLINDEQYDLKLLLDGTIQQLGEQLVVTASVLDLESRRVLWSERWEDDKSAFFDIQLRILERIDNALSTVWTGIVFERKLHLARQHPTENLDAYDHFVLAAAHKHSFSQQDYQIAETHLRSALTIDPEFGKAWALLSMVHAIQSATAPSLAQSLSYSKQRLLAAKRALVYAPNDSDSLMAQSFVYGWQGDFEEATRMARKAIELAPNNSDLLATIAWDSARRTHLAEEGVKWAQRAISLHHRPPSWYQTALGVAAFNAGDFKLAINALQDNPSRAVYTNRYYLALALALDGQLDRAREAGESYNELPGDCWCFSYPATAGDGTPATNELHARGAKLAGIDLPAQIHTPPSYILVDH